MSSDKNRLIEPEQIKMVVALLLVAVIAALLLGLTDMVTRTPIAEAKKAAEPAAADAPAAAAAAPAAADKPAEAPAAAAAPAPAAPADKPAEG